jgi:hypothetical protein
LAIIEPNQSPDGQSPGGERGRGAGLSALAVIIGELARSRTDFVLGKSFIYGSLGDSENFCKIVLDFLGFVCYINFQRARKLGFIDR